jgi:hypothetical protein
MRVLCRGNTGLGGAEVDWHGREEMPKGNTNSLSLSSPRPPTGLPPRVLARATVFLFILPTQDLGLTTAPTAL